MREIRINSVEGPLAEYPRAAQAAVRLVNRGAVMGFLPDDLSVYQLDDAVMARILSALAERGVGTQLAAVLPRHPDGAAWAEILERALEQSAQSPMPAGEWPSLLSTIGEDLLNWMLGISTSSVRRYAAQTRSTPQDVADRLHVLALIVADLAGGYNDYGIRRWFHRARPQLDGKPPMEMLNGSWDPDGDAAARVRELAAALTGAGAT